MQEDDKSISLLVEDNGVGLKENPEKLNHYGLAIIQERSRNLNGSLSVMSIKEGITGTKVKLKFKPAYLADS